MEKFICECGKEFDSYSSRGKHRAHCKVFKEMKNAYLRHKKFCLHCGKELTDEQNWKGVRYCSHRCYSASEEGHQLFDRSLATNRRNPYFNYKQFNRYNTKDNGFLYLVRRGSRLKVGSTQNIYKRLQELFIGDNDLEVIRVIYADSLLISYSETLILNSIIHDNEYININEKNKLINIFDNLVTWLSLNGYNDEYPELLNEYDIKILDISDFRKEYSMIFGGELSKWNYNIDESKLRFSDESHDFSCNFDDEDRLFTLSSGLITHNCRLRLDLRELIKAGGGLFGAGDKTGSIGVVTLNLSKISYISSMLVKGDKDNSDYSKADEILGHYPALRSRVRVLLASSADQDYEELAKRVYFVIIKYFMDLARQSLMIKRDKVQELMDLGIIPYTKKYLGNFNSHFNTLGVNAGHEACLNLLGKGIESEEGKHFMEDTLKFMLKVLSDYQEEDNGQLLWNLEATPAEGASTRFAKKDKKDFKNIITGAGTGGSFYTNSTQLPDNYSENIFEVFEHQDSLQPLYTSGTVQHIYMNESTHNWRVIQSLVKKLFTNYRLPYLSISPDLCVCPIHGKLPHNYKFCPYEHTEEDIQKLLKEGIISEKDILEED